MEVTTVDNYSDGTRKINKRRRVIRLCSNCRERRVKCDFLKPTCTSCQRKNLPRCTYMPNQKIELSTKRSNESMELEIIRLKQEIEQLKQGKLTNTEKDTSAVVDLKRFHFALVKKNRILYFGISAWRSFMHLNSDLAFQYFSFFTTSLKKDRNDWKFLNKMVHEPYHPLTNVEVKQFLVNFLSFLPSYNIMEEYLQRFFTGLWCHFFPLVDEEVIMLNFKRIFVPDGDRVIITVDGSSVDYANVALTVTLIKVILNSELDQPSLPKKFVDDQDMLLRFIDKALEHAKYLRKATLPSLQALFILRVLKKFNWRDGDGGDGSNGSIMFSICIEMAYSMGLHQDIDFLYRTESEHFRKLLKSLWVRLLYYDAIQSFDLGVPLHISDFCLKEELLDKDDLLVRSVLELRCASNILLAPTLTVQTLLERVERLRKFSIANFQPVFKLIKQYQESESCVKSYPVLERIILTCTITTMIQHGYQLLYFSYQDIDYGKSMKYYNLSMKYTLTLVIASVEFCRRTEISKNASPLKEQYIWAEADCLGGGMSRQYFVRCFVFYLSVFVLAAKNAKSGEAPVPHDKVLLKLSELEDLSKDDDPLYENPDRLLMGFSLLNNIVNQSISMILFLKTNEVVADPKKITSKINDYSLFIMILSMNYFQKLLEKDPELHNRVNLNSLDVELVFDTFEEYHPNLFDTEFSDTSSFHFIDDPNWLLGLEQFTEDFFEMYTNAVSQS